MDPLPFDSPIWSQIPTAYGMADEIPELFERCVNGRQSALWEDLHNRVCHQGTPYGCAWALIPHFVRRLDGLDVDGLYTALSVTGTNVRFAPPDAPIEVLNPPYRTALRQLRESLIPAMRSRAAELRDRWDKRGGDAAAHERLVLLADASACLGKARVADLLATMEEGGDNHVACPDCDARLRVFLSADESRAQSVDGTRWAGRQSVSGARPSIDPALRHGQRLLLQPPAAWDERQSLLALASLAASDLGDRTLASAMLGAAGSVMCPSCSRAFPILEYLADAP